MKLKLKRNRIKINKLWAGERDLRKREENFKPIAWIKFIWELFLKSCF